MVIQLLNMLTATNNDDGNNNNNIAYNSNSNQHQSLNGSKHNLTLSLSNHSSNHVNNTCSSAVSDNNFGQAITINKLQQQDAATSPTIPLLSTLLYGTQVNSSSLFYSSTADNYNDINNNNITPPSTSTSLGCSSPIISRSSPQLNGHVNNSNNNNNTINMDTINNNIILNKNTNNQQLTSGNGTIKTLVIKSNCRPSDLVCRLKSPNTCLACYTNCSTCNKVNNVNSKSINQDYNYNSSSSFSRLTNTNNSSIKRLNEPGRGLNGLNGINSNYFPVISGLGFVNSYGAVTIDGPGRNNTLVSGLTTAVKASNKDGVNSIHSTGNVSNHHPLITTTTGIVGTTINISPTEYDDYHHLSSPSNTRTNDKFDNFNSNIFNDHCSAISAPLSQYYLDEPRNHGCFRKSIPSMPIALSAFLLLLNCFLPGSGTILSSITILFGCPTEYGKGKWKRAFLLTLIAGILQFLTAIVVIGWVWSIMTGINFIKHSTKMKDAKFGYADAL